MTIRWKIFRIANIVEIFLTAIILVLMLAVNNLSFNNTEDIIGIAICTLVTAIVTWNCISNMLFLRPSGSHKIYMLPSRARFWVMSILFLIACVFVIFCIVSLWVVFKRIEHTNRRDYFGMLIMVGWLSLIAANGIYIFIQQVIFFTARRKENLKGDNEAVDEIGNAAG